MSVYDFKPNFPGYQDVKPGDILVWYMGDTGKYDMNGNMMVHGHWFEVLRKHTRYAQVTLRKLRCDNPTGASCTDKNGSVVEIGWSKLQSYQHKTRWLRTPGAKVLFSQRG